jgi:hypothetical protein
VRSLTLALALCVSLFTSFDLTAQEVPKKDPIAFSGGIYLFEYAPTTKGAKDKFEIYALVLNLDTTSEDGKYGLHVQGRARDSKLRPFFLSNVWFQEAYAFAKTGVGDVHVGKFYRKVGILWDDSFFGNVQYFNGLKLNPDYGAELVGTRPMNGALSVDYSAQYLNNNDHVAGSLDGRDVESDPNAQMHSTFTARVVPTWKLSADSSVAVGVSGLSGRIERTGALSNGGSFRMSQLGADVTFQVAKSISYLELLRQNGEPFDAFHPQGRLGYDDADYLLAGSRYQLTPKTNIRLNVSRVKYRGHREVETEVVPGVVYGLNKHITLIGEYDWWKTDPDAGPSTFIDKSLNFVIHYGF